MFKSGKTQTPELPYLSAGMSYLCDKLMCVVVSVTMGYVPKYLPGAWLGSRREEALRGGIQSASSHDKTPNIDM